MIDFRQVLKTQDGSDMTEVTAGPDGTPVTRKVTLSLLACNALNQGSGSEPLSGEEHLKRFLLAQKVKDEEVALSVEEIALIKARIAKMYVHPLIAGQALLMLDPAAGGAEEKPTKGKNAA